MDFKAPTDWEPMEDDGAARDPAWLSRHALVAVPLDSDLGLSLQHRLCESLPHARMVSLERIQHRGLWRSYARRRDDVVFYNDNDAGEILMWHGTGARAPSAVLAHQEGLDPRFSDGGFYGKGIYLAGRAAYPVGGRYAHRVAGHGGTRFQLLLVRVAAGAVQDFGAEVTAATRAMRFPGSRAAGGRLYDCVVAGPHRPHISGAGGPGDTDASRICVVYQADQMYPAFVCTFDLSFASLPAAASSPVARTGVPARRAAVPQPATLVNSLRAQQQQQAAAPSLNIYLYKKPEGEEVWFKVKTTTKLQKVFDLYATRNFNLGRRKGIDVGSLRFFLDGTPLNGDQTPEDVGMEDGGRVVVYEVASSARASKRARQV